MELISTKLNVEFILHYRFNTIRTNNNRDLIILIRAEPGGKGT